MQGFAIFNNYFTDWVELFIVDHSCKLAIKIILAIYWIAFKPPQKKLKHPNVASLCNMFHHWTKYVELVKLLWIYTSTLRSCVTAGEYRQPLVGHLFSFVETWLFLLLKTCKSLDHGAKHQLTVLGISPHCCTGRRPTHTAWLLPARWHCSCKWYTLQQWDSHHKGLLNLVHDISCPKKKACYLKLHCFDFLRNLTYFFSVMTFG